MPKPGPGIARQLAQAGTIGLSLAACIFIGAAMGILLDHWLGTKPWLTLVFLILGIVAGFTNVVRLVADLNRSQKRPE